LTVSEQKAEQISGEPGSLSAGPATSSSSGAQWEHAAALALEINTIASPRIAPDHEAPKADEPKLEASKIEAPKVEVSKADAPQAAAAKPDAPKADVPKPDALKPDALKPDARKADAARSPGKVIVMSAGDRSWDRARAGAKMASGPGQGLFGNRRLSALAAVVALAVVAGALGGALLTASLTHLASDGTAGAGSTALEASVARIDTEILALKASVEHTSQAGLTQLNKTSDRLDRVEKAQTEPLAKLARLSEAVDKLRAAPAAVAPVAAAPAAAKEVTGSIATPPSAPAASAPKVEVGRLPTVEGWVLRDIANGSALIEGRHGMYEVYAGDPIPGLGRVEAIRRQDGRWVVVTSKGLIVAR
jgi:hypothetical protein